MAHSNSKKRQAINTPKNLHNQIKKAKLKDPSISNTKKGGLFDDSDEEMDPTVMKSVIQHLGDDDQNTSIDNYDSDSDDMDLNDNTKRDSDGDNNNNSSDDNDDNDDYSISSSEISEVDPVSDLVEAQEQDQTLLEDGNDDMAVETESQQTKQSSPSATKHDLSGKFRDHYMGQMTLAFGSDLDTIRQEPGFTGASLGVLIDSLESGITVFSDLEKRIILANVDNS